jgi:amino acid adenylation domain-containing protein
MDPEFPAERLAMMVGDSDMKLILSQRSVRESLPATKVPVLGLDEVPAGGAFTPVAVDQNATAYVIFTSGSTGRPKGVRIPHRAVVNFLNSMRREPGLNADDVLLSVTTLSFDIAGLEIFLPLTTGACTVIADRDTTRDGLLLAKAIEDHRITCLQATPATWRLLLEGGWAGSKRLKVLVGGEAVPRELVNRLSPICAEVWNVYGPTETTIWSTAARVEAGEGPVSIGRPIDNTQVYVVSPALQLQPVGVAGELLIGGEGLAEGYHRLDELTRDRFIDSPFGGGRLYRTGDLARWNADGTLECLGRMDHQVKVRGFRIELGEIETLLEKHADVEQAAVHLSDEKIVACVRTTSSNDGSEALIRTLRSHLQQQLPEYMIPSAFVFMVEFPLTPNGKVDRKALPGGDQAIAVSREPVAPRDENERRILAVWQEVMKRDDLGVEDDIFEMGGDSIQIFQIASRLSQQGVAITPADIFRDRTVSVLARLQPTDKTTTTASPTIQRVDRAAYRRTT